MVTFVRVIAACFTKSSTPTAALNANVGVGYFGLNGTTPLGCCVQILGSILGYIKLDAGVLESICIGRRFERYTRVMCDENTPAFWQHTTK